MIATLRYFPQMLSAEFEEVVEEAVVIDDALNQSEQPDYTQVGTNIYDIKSSLHLYITKNIWKALRSIHIE